MISYEDLMSIGIKKACSKAFRQAFSSWNYERDTHRQHWPPVMVLSSMSKLPSFVSFISFKKSNILAMKKEQ